MATKTTDTTYDAGVSPLHPEASKEQIGKPRFLYVLLLEDGCYYVGSTDNPDRRFQQHQEGKAANWTRLHRPISLLECLSANTSSQAECEKQETKLAMSLMKRHGIEKVRGGLFHSLDDAKTAKKLRAAELGRIFKRTGGI